MGRNLNEHHMFTLGKVNTSKMVRIAEALE